MFVLAKDAPRFEKRKSRNWKKVERDVTGLRMERWNAELGVEESKVIENVVECCGSTFLRNRKVIG